MLQTLTTLQIAHHHSLYDTESNNARSSILLILPEMATSSSHSTGDSIQQPSDPPFYIRLDEDWRASGILHDFNNQLAIILSHCSIALTKLPAESTARSNLERSIRATKRAADLSSQLQIGIAAQETEFSSIHLNELVQETLDALEPRIPAKVALEIQYAVDLPVVMVNPPLIHRMLVNILFNAFDSLQADGGHINVSTNSIAIAESGQQSSGQNVPPGRYVVIQVSDTGHGIDQTTLNQIFSPYFSTKAVGVGMGLTLAMHIMQLHEGIIQVQSTPAYGTSFRLYFPL